MAAPVVKEEISYRTVTTTKNPVTTTKKSVVSRLTNVNAVQVNCYDSKGNLKWKDGDKESWEERDTQNYEWSGLDKPSHVDASLIDKETNRCIFPVNLNNAIKGAEDGTNVVLTTSDICNTPSIKWSGKTENLEINPDSEHKTSTNIDGSKWTRNEETVWMSTGKQNTIKPFNVIKGVIVDDNQTRVSDKTEKVICTDTVVRADTVQSNGGGGFPSSVVSPPSPAQRRAMRRNVNREISSSRNQVEK